MMRFVESVVFVVRLDVALRPAWVVVNCDRLSVTVRVEGPYVSSLSC